MPTHMKIPLLVLILALPLAGCVDDGKGGSSDNSVTADEFDFTAMFANYADNIILPNYRLAADRAAELGGDSGAIANYCQSMGAAGEAAARSGAGAAWDSAMSAIQQTEMHIIGPATDNNNALANRLNSSAAAELSRCGVDQSVVQFANDTNFNIESKTISQRGIGAVEYLLFNTDLDHNCPSQIRETADWDSRPDEQRRQLRCEYAVVVANDIANAASSLHDAWSTNGGDYRSNFVNPANATDSLKQLSDAMFYLDLDVKDRKLGVPTGINDGCSEFSCPDSVESPYREYTLQSVRANLESFGKLMSGGTGLGFDDLINISGMPALSQRFQDNTTSAIEVIDQSSSSLLDLVSAIDSAAAETECTNAFANPDVVGNFPACNLVGHIKALTDDLKVGFVAAIDVDLPDRAQTDND